MPFDGFRCWGGGHRAMELGTLWESRFSPIRMSRPGVSRACAGRAGGAPGGSLLPSTGAAEHWGPWGAEHEGATSCKQHPGRLHPEWLSVFHGKHRQLQQQVLGVEVLQGLVGASQGRPGPGGLQSGWVLLWLSHRAARSARRGLPQQGALCWGGPEPQPQPAVPSSPFWQG